jgi:peptide/nickel transport system ATP-binding protein
VSALDVAVLAQILNLLEYMMARYGLTLVFTAHDLGVVRNISDRVAVMYLGKLCEVGGPEEVYLQPRHPYTAALLRSIPVPDPTVLPTASGLVKGDLPSPIDPPSGCRFRTRCPRAEARCAAEEPQLRQMGDGHHVACHFPLDVSEAASVADAVTGDEVVVEVPADSPVSAPRARRAPGTGRGGAARR